MLRDAAPGATRSGCASASASRGRCSAIPRILVLDEPANGLDPQGIRWLREFLRSLAAEGRTIFISSHVLAEVEQIVDEVVIIHRGKFVVQATTAELVARAAGGIRARSPQADQLRAALEEAGVKVASSEGDLLTLADATTAQVGEIAAAKGIVLHELVAESSSLEEAFLDLTSQEEVHVMRLVTAELLKVWTAPRVLLGILLSELAIVLIGTIATIHSAVNDPVLPQI